MKKKEKEKNMKGRECERRREWEERGRKVGKKGDGRGRV